MAQLPLISAPDLDAVFAWREDKPILVRDFLHDVRRMAAAMPPRQHVLNACRDRYGFGVGFAAALVSGRVSLLPSTRTPDTAVQLRTFAPDVFCLSDVPCDFELPCMPYPLPGCAAAPQDTLAMPMIDSDRVVAHVFTSGSTGAPIPHRKTWGALVGSIPASAARLGLRTGPRHTLVGTVPTQHMYGFESTLLLALHGGVALGAAHPFYPADVATALARVPAPRLLVTTPVHLRALLAADVSLPSVAAVLSATAPLALDLAREVETRLGAPLLEIYGSTETGQIATRRPAQSDVWELFPGVSLHTDAAGVTMASGGHVIDAIALNDVIEQLDAQHFRLLGRSTDMVNIAGRRSSLAYLNHQLGTIPGVHDGAFFMPPGSGSDVTRLMAFVVAPDLRREDLLAALRQRVDPAFLPRPLVVVDALPRNATGKLPRAELAALAASLPASKLREAVTDAR